MPDKEDICKNDRNYQCDPKLTEYVCIGINPEDPDGNPYPIEAGCPVEFSDIETVIPSSKRPTAITTCDVDECGKVNVYLLSPRLPPVKVVPGVKKREYLIAGPNLGDPYVLEPNQDPTQSLARATTDERKGLAEVTYV